jgi:hypothetical protein
MMWRCVFADVSKEQNTSSFEYTESHPRRYSLHSHRYMSLKCDIHDIVPNKMFSLGTSAHASQILVKLTTASLAALNYRAGCRSHYKCKGSSFEHSMCEVVRVIDHRNGSD